MEGITYDLQLLVRKRTAKDALDPERPYELMLVIKGTIYPLALFGKSEDELHQRVADWMGNLLRGSV